MAPAVVATDLASALKDAAYWKGEAQKAIREREEVKKSLGDPDGPSAYWRREAKDAQAARQRLSLKLEDALRKVEAQRQKAIAFSEDADGLRATIATAKRAIWDLFSGLADDDPTKKTLWDIFGAL